MDKLLEVARAATYLLRAIQALDEKPEPPEPENLCAAVCCSHCHKPI